MLLDDPVELLDADGSPVRVTGRGLFSADPSRLAGPGGRTGCPGGQGRPVDERGGIPNGQGGTHCQGTGAARRDPAQALLLCYRQRPWCVEGAYE